MAVSIIYHTHFEWWEHHQNCKNYTEPSHILIKSLYLTSKRQIAAKRQLKKNNRIGIKYWRSVWSLYNTDIAAFNESNFRVFMMVDQIVRNLRNALFLTAFERLTFFEKDEKRDAINVVQYQFRMKKRIENEVKKIKLQ